jgi:hypothetical protein
MRKVALTLVAATALLLVLVGTGQATQGNLAQWEPTAASSTVQPNATVRAVDGMNGISNYWESGGGSTQQWFQIDFGGSFYIGHFLIWWDTTHYATGYTISGSDDGVNWHNVPYVKSGGVVSQTATTNAVARFWRINMIARVQGAQTYRIHELEAFSF